MDAGRIAELRAWARQLETRADDGELRAAAKAILLLVGEVERLQAGESAPPTGDAVEPEPAADEAVSEEQEDAGLLSRLRRTFGYGGEP
jgi:hypothetical protein